MLVQEAVVPQLVHRLPPSVELLLLAMHQQKRKRKKRKRRNRMMTWCVFVLVCSFIHVKC
jgi:hypothetical protein